MMNILRGMLRRALAVLGLPLRAGFLPDSMNPLRHLGALTIFFFWIVLVSGIWLLVFFRTSVDGAYESVEYLTHDQWYLGGVMRSLHRYASDAAIITLVLHIVRPFALDQYRGKRWFSWVTGVPLLWLVIPLGITGYWLVWDQLAQYVALASAELLDWIPIFTDSMASNFLSDDAVSNRFFTLMAFLHLIGLPLFLVLGIWLHVLRINGPEINPPRELMAGCLLAMLLLSLVFPAVSQDKADLATVPSALSLDWYYLLIYPLIDRWPLGWVWALLVGITLLLTVAPWLPPKRAAKVARVDLDNCNGCERCVADCPFSALTMEPRSDGKAYDKEAVVDANLCTSCGICVGACPTATPFRSRSELVPGIDLPDSSMARLRDEITGVAERLSGDGRILVFSCEVEGPGKLEADCGTGIVQLTCMAQLPPSFLDFVLSRDLADGVWMAGCGPDGCRYRLGANWTEQRVGRVRDPYLRKRVDDARIAMAWSTDWSRYSDPKQGLAAFRASLAGSGDETDRPRRATRGRRVSFQGMAYLLFAAAVGLFSVWPTFSLVAPSQAIVSLAFSHAGQRIGECRRYTQQELQEMPPNMRRPADCPRQRHPVLVVMAVDGVEHYREEAQPSGLWDDGESDVYQRLKLEAGQHSLYVGMRESGPGEGFDYELRRVIQLDPGQHVVVDFDQTHKQFKIR